MQYSEPQNNAEEALNISEKERKKESNRTQRKKQHTNKNKLEKCK